MKKITTLFVLAFLFIGFTATAQVELRAEKDMQSINARDMVIPAGGARAVNPQAELFYQQMLKSDKAVLFYEGFENWDPDLPWALPAGWQRFRTDALAGNPFDNEISDMTPQEELNWFLANPDFYPYSGGAYTDYVQSGSGSLGCYWDADDFTWAVTPEFTIIDSEGDIILSFWPWLSNNFENGWITKFHVRILSEGSWINLWSYNAEAEGSNIFAEQKVFSLNAFKGQDIRIAFIHEWNDGIQMAIDEVYVGEELNDDFGLSGLSVFPTFGILPGTEVQLGVDVFCNGNNPGTVEVSLVANGVVVDTHTTEELELGGESEFVLFNWVPEEFGDYLVQIVLPEDDFVGNNLVGRSLTVYHGYNFAEDFENIEFDDLGIPELVFPPAGWVANDPEAVFATATFAIADDFSAAVTGRDGEGEKILITHGVELTAQDQWIGFLLEGLNNAVSVGGVVQGHSTFQLKYGESAEGPWNNLGDPIEMVNLFDEEDNFIIGANTLRYVEHDISDLSGTIYFAFTATSNFDFSTEDTDYRSWVIIDNVMVGSDPAYSIVDIIVESDDHATLLAAVLAAELEGALADEGPFTVFAPNDAAFDALPDGLLDELLADPAGALTDILLYHVVPAKALSGDLEDGQTITTLQGQDLVVTIDGDDVFINDAKVIAANLEADNGVVHVIDAVLVPEPSLVYSITIPLAAGEVPYKYFLVPNDVEETWDLGEWAGDPNRIVEVTADVVLNDVWGDQPIVDDNGDLKNAAEDVFMVTFNVEMIGAMVGEGEDAIAFDPELHRVFIAGGFGGDINWNQPGSNPDLEMTVGGGVVSVEEVRQAERPAVVLYPNPANNHVVVNAGTGNINRVEVYNLTGSRVLALDINNATHNLDVSEFTTGIYIVRVFTDNAGIVNQKLQITR